MSSDTTERLKFDVFGRVMVVERRSTQWQLYDVGAEGKRSPVRDVVVPASLDATEVQRFLADLFHEHATSRHPDVRRLIG